MRICLIARNRFHADRKAIVTYRVLQRAGHELVVVAVDRSAPEDPVTATVPGKVAPVDSRLRRLNRLIPAGLEMRVLTRRLASVAARLEAEVYLPLQEEVLGAAIEAARRAGGVVQRAPGMPSAGSFDLIELAPAQPHLAQPAHGLGPYFTPTDMMAPSTPSPGRYSGERAVICYRKTEANPGRYLEMALIRAGFEVRLVTDAIDLDSVDPTTSFVIFVEGPYPAIEVSGATQVPTLFWAHHGEHHLLPNLRLADRYRADAVLLAHSWHLAHWFPAPVHRFPFAVAPELFSRPQPLAARKFDVAMVGSKLRGDAWQYRRRMDMVAALESAFGSNRVRFVEGVTPEGMASLYGDSRIVLNEGGVRHYPITMRVFEAVGAGAVLLSDTPPGLDLLLEPNREYAMLSLDVVADVERLLGSLETAQRMADNATKRAAAAHTYDHRVDQLVTIASQTIKREVPVTSPRTSLGRIIDGDVEVQRLLHDGVPGLADELPDREVWPLAERAGRLGVGSMDAAVIARETVAGIEPLLDSARRYIYAKGDVAGLDEYLESRHPEAVSSQEGQMRRIDLMTEAYRVKTRSRL